MIIIVYECRFEIAEDCEIYAAKYFAIWELENYPLIPLSPSPPLPGSAVGVKVMVPQEV